MSGRTFPTDAVSFTELTRRPVGMVLLVSNDGKPDMTFDPQPDITPFENAMLLNLAVMLLRPHAVPDWRGYIEQHQLGRHFKEATYD